MAFKALLLGSVMGVQIPAWPQPRGTPVNPGTLSISTVTYRPEPPNPLLPTASPPQASRPNDTCDPHSP